MSYTPTNWQTGDVVTAEKLNKLENGVTSAQVYTESEEVRFSGEVTTEGQGGVVGAEIECDLSDTPEQITVVFDGTEYTVNKVAVGSSYGYGSFISGPDFSQYPFFISHDLSTNSNILFTETAGTHQVEITSITTSVNEDFADLIPVMQLISGVTNSADALAAFSAGKLLYFTYQGSFSVVTGIDNTNKVFITTPSDETISCHFSGTKIDIDSK